MYKIMFTEFIPESQLTFNIGEKEFDTNNLDKIIKIAKDTVKVLQGIRKGKVSYMIQDDVGILVDGIISNSSSK